MTNYRLFSLRFCYDKGKNPSHTAQELYIILREGKFDYQKSVALKILRQNCYLHVINPDCVRLKQ